MKALLDHATARSDSFAGDLGSRLEVVRERVRAESLHLDQVAAVAETYLVPLLMRLTLVR